ncbi:saccharopine dehydrogenase family protein [Halopiger xanaduensis]|uniref:Saccharopine dehydrogenase n=1 Tax=Halopiger xanaduensis (strain DSM 18323 / JCM 14033 / SH-6) TaxID=797210 RepID=F8D684_HALXS|nr:saccharopine dehydrogenase NADP-binding domain-containing protein [Halopiger xanaduensis]AEH35330.1 Saccharopine dehydrogenase [Halopiger xanaduensis SH-6]
MPSVLLYGSYGFVGNLMAREAIDRIEDGDADFDLLLAGRNGDRLREQVDDLERPGYRFALEDPDTVAEALERAEADCVLNCAGPFSNTAGPLVEGCVRTGTDYVDITGEIPVIESIADRDADGADAGVTLLPAAAFSAVPMDCLAAHLVDRLPEATTLAMGVDSLRPPSIGTVRTLIEGFEDGGAVYRDGRLEHVPTAWRTRRIDFGRGERPAVTMPTGDVSTAHYTTGVPNVAVYALMPQPARLALKSHRYLAPLLEPTPVREGLKWFAGLVREGPSSRSRKRGSTYVWGEARVEDDGGEFGGDESGEPTERVVSRLQTPDAYVVTVEAALAATERVLAGDAEDGFQTPAGAFGPEFVLALEGVEGFFDESKPESAPPEVDVSAP